MKKKAKVSLKMVVIGSSLGSESPRAGCVERNGGDGTKGRSQRCFLMIRVLDTVVWETEEELSFSTSAEDEAFVTKNGLSGNNAFCPTQDSPRFFSLLV